MESEIQFHKDPEGKGVRPLVTGIGCEDRGRVGVENTLMMKMMKDKKLLITILILKLIQPFFYF